MEASSTILKIYADLIQKGLKKIEDVPEQIRNEVKVLLEK